MAEKIKERLAKNALELEVLSENSENSENKEDIAESQTVYESEEQQKITEETRKKNVANEDEDLEDEEIPIRDLSGFSTEILNTLETNGFETLAELSVTPLEELIAIDGLDENLGLEILEKVKQQLGNVENA